MPLLLRRRFLFTLLRYAMPLFLRLIAAAMLPCHIDARLLICHAYADAMPRFCYAFIRYYFSPAFAICRHCFIHYAFALIRAAACLPKSIIACCRFRYHGITKLRYNEWFTRYYVISPLFAYLPAGYAATLFAFH